jgi:hypothetical protein
MNISDTPRNVFKEDLFRCSVELLANFTFLFLVPKEFFVP